MKSDSTIAKNRIREETVASSDGSRCERNLTNEFRWYSLSFARKLIAISVIAQFDDSHSQMHSMMSFTSMMLNKIPCTSGVREKKLIGGVAVGAAITTNRRPRIDVGQRSTLEENNGFKLAGGMKRDETG